jgi:hypothetical protein
MAYPADETQPYHPHNDHESHEPLVQRCPTCGQTSPPFVPRTSGLLDLVLIAKDALTEVQAALEEEVLS